MAPGQALIQCVPDNGGSEKDGGEAVAMTSQRSYATAADDTTDTGHTV